MIHTNRVINNTIRINSSHLFRYRVSKFSSPIFKRKSKPLCNFRHQSNLSLRPKTLPSPRLKAKVNHNRKHTLKLNQWFRLMDHPNLSILSRVKRIHNNNKMDICLRSHTHRSSPIPFKIIPNHICKCLNISNLLHRCIILSQLNCNCHLTNNRTQISNLRFNRSL